jgi:4-amino-4-deoxy-L-arabinose transferase-like glycosyltransferase
VSTATADPTPQVDPAPSTPTWSPWRVAAGLGGAAAALRVVWVLAMSRTPEGLTDLTLYPYFAEGIAEGRGYLSLGQHPTAYYPPGYPFFLGGLQWLLDRVGLGEHLVLVAGLVQALLGGIAVGAVVVAGARLGGPRVAWAAGLLVALWPNLVIHTSAMLSETLFIALFTVTLAALLHVSDRERWWSPALLVAGLGLGACTLVRPQSTFLALPAIAVAWALASWGWRRWALRVGALVVGVVVVVAPWTVRNAVVLDGFVPVSTNTGDNLCIGFNPDTTGGFMAAQYCETGEFYVQGIAQELRRDREARALAIDWATANLAELPALSLRKLGITYANDRDGLRALESFEQDRFLADGTRRALGALVDVYFFAVLALAVVGLGLGAVRGWRERGSDPAPLLVVAVTLTAVLVPVLSFADTRFKVPVAPCFALLAALAISAAIGRWRDAPARAQEASQ